MSKYIFVGNGDGVGGIPNEIDQAIGDQWMSDYEAAEKDETKRAKDKDYIPAYLEGMPGYILKCALANKNHKLDKQKSSEVKE